MTNAKCPDCGKMYSVEKSMAGRKLRCRRCHKIFPVTPNVHNGAGGGNGVIRLKCPSCRTVMKVHQTAVGKKVKCPKCQHISIVPGGRAAPPPPPPPKPQPKKNTVSPSLLNLAADDTACEQMDTLDHIDIPTTGKKHDTTIIYDTSKTFRE